jgi:DNA-binding SARP family transcriptional activator/tetratricopeptide (TPR) repeat protein/DNA-binding XRE family transcriptional regulator
LAALVRGNRETAGLTQRQLARRAGISLGALQDLEQGRTTCPRPRSLVRLASALQLSTRQLDELTSAAAASAACEPEATRTARGRRTDRSGLRVEMLGPLAAWRAGVPVSLGPVGQRALLGLLLLHADAGLPRSAIVDALWGESPPQTSTATIRRHVTGIRRVLGAGQPASEPPLSWDGSCYRLSPGVVRLDITDFTDLAQKARQAAAGDAYVACGLYEQALRLWRGSALEDIEVLRGHPATVGLGRQRAAVVTEYADLAARAGLHDRVIPHLEALVAREPLDERAHAQLMVTLAGTGHQAAALSIYRDLADRLDSELGVTPGPELSAAHLQVLRQEIIGAPVPAAAGTGAPPAATRSQAGTGWIAPEPGPPRQLPPFGRHFTGRAGEMAALTRWLDQAGGEAAGPVLISAIGGTAGVGKTALAVHWAHQSADRFPDGQLYVNLRGYDPGQPVQATDALAGFLRALGVTGQDLPAGEDERAARYRSLLAGRRMLVVLDNAGDIEQVRPLLPGARGCAAIVTSRDSLGGLVARDGAWRLDLDLLPLPEAVGLLQALIGGRADAEPLATAELASQCSRLPLALRVAAELAAGRPTVTLADLVGELADQQQRLDLLDAGGDPRTAVRAVLSWSCRHLAAGTSRAFGLAGFHPGSDLDAYALAALAGVTPALGRRLLDALARAHLMHVTGPGRYGMHDLLRAYARELAADQDGEAARRAALTRLFDYYQQTASAAMTTLFPAEQQRRPRLRPSAAPVSPVAEPTAARAWLEAERAGLVAVAAYTAEHGWPGHAVRLAATLFRYLDGGGHFAEAITVHTCALRAARRTGDRAAEATALTDLGVALWRQGHGERAVGHFQSALALCRATGDPGSQNRALHNCGLVYFQQGRLPEAISYLERALALTRRVSDPIGTARVLSNLGVLCLYQGRWQDADGYLRQALKLARETGDSAELGRELGPLGFATLRMGRYAEAAGYLREAANLCRETSDRAGEIAALSGLGDVCLRQGRYQQAEGHLQRALALAREAGERAGEAHALMTLGAACLRQGRCPAAITHLQQALALAREAGYRVVEAHVLADLGRAYLRQGRYPEATAHVHPALALARETGARPAETSALAVLGDLLLATDQPGSAHTRYVAALRLARQAGDQDQQAAAHNGLACAHHAVGNSGGARHHWQRALAIYAGLGAPEAEQVRAQLTEAATHPR